MWGVAAMVVKDVVKNPYLKGRDYERNVRQVYRDVDNLRITMDQVKTNCAGEDLENGPYSPVEDPLFFSLSLYPRKTRLEDISNVEKASS